MFLNFQRLKTFISKQLVASHRLSDGEDAVDAAQVGGEKPLGGDLPAAPGRGAEYDLAAPGDPGGEGEHQHRREERGIAARDVEPHAADGYGTLHAPHASFAGKSGRSY